MLQRFKYRLQEAISSNHSMPILIQLSAGCFDRGISSETLNCTNFRIGKLSTKYV